jgi:predicted site-specific integrase-resolvase
MVMDKKLVKIGEAAKLLGKGEQPSFEEELAKNFLEIITVLNVQLYGA